MSKPTALPLTWKSTEPVWIEQWPLPEEKLAALHDLVKEQLAAGHIEPTTSPFNSPVFVIRKKSGRWRFIHDLRSINFILQPMGALQCGTPNPNMIPRDYQIIIVDLKDCFFSIPICDKDKQFFAFTVPVLNASQPTARYHWTVLPQGMLNSPTLCQHFVAKALEPFRKRYPNALIYHFMDDILIASPQIPAQWLEQLANDLKEYGLEIAQEKIQLHEPFLYLGHKVLQTFAHPQIPQLQIPQVLSYVKLQQLLGSINWLRPFVGLPTGVLSPVFEALKNKHSPAEQIVLNDAQKEVFKQVNEALKLVWVDRCQEGIPLILVIIPTAKQPTAVVAQEKPPINKGKASLLIIEWIYLSHTPSHTLSSPAQLQAELIFRGRERCRILLGMDPVKIIVPMPMRDWERMLSLSTALQAALTDYVGHISYHIPADPRLLAFNQVEIIVQKGISLTPLPHALTVFTDGGAKWGAAAWFENGKWVTKITPPQKSAQRAEIAAVILALQVFPDKALNIITDSQYVSQLVISLPGAYVTPSLDQNLLSLFLTLQQCLQHRRQQIHIAHIRSHQPFPGFISEGNAVADAATKEQIFVVTPWESHAMFHQNAKALARQFKIPIDHARAIIQQCPQCSQITASPFIGTNPRGLKANELWQADITQYPSFAPWKYLHVTVDTCSGYIWATPQKGEATKHVINHFMRTFAVMGLPQTLKTDNGSAYCSAKFAEFCAEWGIKHLFGIPYNSTGQAIVERANQTLKNALNKHKQTGGNPVGLPGKQEWLNKVLFTLNHLNIKNTSTAVEDHFGRFISHPKPQVMYRLLPQAQWEGPGLLLNLGRGFAAVLTPAGPVWVPARCVKPWRDGVAPRIAEPDPGLLTEPTGSTEGSQPCTTSEASRDLGPD